MGVRWMPSGESRRLVALCVRAIGGRCAGDDGDDDPEYSLGLQAMRPLIVQKQKKKKPQPWEETIVFL